MATLVQSSIPDDRLFDLIVIGGGIHGAAAARFAAGSGFSVLLMERGDFASGTSSRSSKMAHGGLRYLEMFDFEQVFEGIKARESLFDSAPHLVRPESFLIPVPKGAHWFAWKLKAGLFLYDRFVQREDRRHSWIPRSELSFPGFDSSRNDLEGCYRYCDGLMNDARLVLENLLVACSRGAIARSYCEVVGLSHNPLEESWTVSWRDRLTSEKGVVRSRMVLNCAGPWVLDLATMAAVAEKPQVKFSRGIHLLFPVTWSGPSLFLPMPGRSRYYFVWPHAAGTMVGTTEREVESCEDDPIPLRDEVLEIYDRIARDLRNTALAKSEAHYGFAGIRTIPFRTGNAGTATLSRKHLWLEERGFWSLVGGKYTTAYWTAREGVSKICSALDVAPVATTEELTPLPGAFVSRSAQEVFQQLADGGYSTAASNRLIQRLGARALEVLHIPNGSREIAHGLSVGEIQHAVVTEGARTLEDVMRRRLELELLPGNGLEVVEEIANITAKVSPHHSAIGQQVKLFRERMRTLASVIKRETH